MSQVKIQGNAAGTGQFTIAAPNSNNNRNLILPDSDGTLLNTATSGVPIGGPAFSAYQSSTQTLAAATWTKLSFQTEEFDTNSCYDNVTNYRFLPNVAGYYQINGGFRVTTARAQLQTGIYKNGTLFKELGNDNTASAFNTGSAVVFLNGSTDYVELWGYSSVGSNVTTASSTATYFQASLIRSSV